MHEGEPRYNDIIERILVFQANFPTFTERTGLDFIDLMSMDPSTMTYMQNTWAELMKPEMLKAQQTEQEMKKLGGLANLLKNMGR